MAGNNEILVDIGADGADLLQDLNKATAALGKVVENANRISQSFKNSTRDAEALTKKIMELQKQLKNAQSEADKLRIRGQIQGASTSLDLSRQVIQDNRVQSAARGAATNRMMQSTTSDGRTFDQVRLQDQAVRLNIQALNTTAQQQSARLAEAAKKAAQRMIETTGAAIEAQINQTNFRNIMRMRDFTGAGLDRSFVLSEASRVSRDRTFQRQYGMSVGEAAQFPPSQLPSVLLAAAKAQEQLNAANKEAVRLERERQAAIKAGIAQDFAAARKERAEAERAARRAEERIARQRTQAENAGIRQDFAAARREADPNTVARLARMDETWQKRIGMTAGEFQALHGNKDIQERLRLYKQLTEETRRRAQAEKEAASAAARSDARYRRSLAAELRRTAAERARELDPNYAIRQQSRNEAFFNRYGVARQDFESRAANMELRERIKLLQELREKNLQTSAAERERRRAANAPSAQDIARRSMEINRERFNLNGGADVFGMQGRLLFNYALMGTTIGGVSALVREIVQLDDTLARFQAITQTSNAEMVGFREGLLEVAEASRYSVSELAQVSIQLGQTGLSAKEVTETLPAITQFATAAGSTLTQATDIVTATMGAFQVEAGRAREVVNVFTAALNQTRLSMEQLQLGMSYAANIAREAGLNFTELTSSIASVAQAGIRSGSTIGTGLRQLIQDLIAPSDKLKGIFDDLGITMLDVDLKTNGLVGVLENLRAKGFGAAEALEGFDLRAAASFSALVGQLDVNRRLNESLLLTDAAAEGAAIAQDSITASAQRLGNNIVALIDRGSEPLIDSFTTLLNGTTALVQGFQDFSSFIPIIVTGLGSLAGAITLINVTRLVSGLAGLAGVATALSGTLPVLIGAGAIAGIVGISYAFSKVGDEAQRAAERLDELRGRTNELAGEEQKLTTTINSIDQEIERVVARRERLNSDALDRRAAIISAQQAFREFGLDVSASADSVDELIDALRNLRGELQGQLGPLLGSQAAALQRQVEQQKEGLSFNAFEIQERLSDYRPMGATLNGGLERQRAVARRFFGPEMDDIFDLFWNPMSVNLEDVRGDVADEQRALNDARKKLQQQIEEARAGGRDTTGLESLVDYLDAISVEFEGLVVKLQAIQGNNLRIEALQSQQRQADLRATPQAAQFFADAINLEQEARRTIEEIQAIGMDQELSPTEIRDRYIEATEMLDERAQALLDRIPQIREQLVVALGVSDEDLNALIAEMEAQVAQFAGKENPIVKDAIDTAKKIEEALLKREGRSVDQQIQRQLQIASRSQDPNRLREIGEYIETLVDRKREITTKLFELDQGIRNGRMTAEQRLMLEQSQEEIDGQLEKYVEELAELRRKIVDEAFNTEIERLDILRRSTENQIEKLQTELDKPNTTEERARELIQSLEELFDRLNGIIQQGVNARADRALFQLADPALMAESGGPGAQALLGALREQGLSEQMISYVMAMAKRESNFNTQAVNPDSGASGIFQFLPKTWREYNSDPSMIFDLQAQIDAMLRFTQDNINYFQQRMGREPNAREMYLLHQQGRAGGTALLQNPDANAVDVLAPFYDSRRIAASAVTGNAGDVNMTAGQFAEHVMRMLDRSAQAANIEMQRQTGLEEANSDTAEQRSDAERRQREITDRERDARLRTLTVETQRSIESRSVRLRNAGSVDEARGLATEMVDELTDLIKERREALTESQDFADLTPAGQEARLAEFDQSSSEEVQQQILANAREIGELTRRRYEEEVRIAQTNLEQLQLAQQRGAATDIEVANAQRAVDEAQRKLDLEGETEATKAEILAIEEQIEQLRNSGVSSESELLSLQERLNELKREEVSLEQQAAAAAEVGARQPSLVREMEGATSRFLQSRGIIYEFDRMVPRVVEGGRLMEEALGSVGSAMENLFYNLATGSMSAGEAFRKFALDVLADMAKLAARALTNEFFRLFFGVGQGGGGGGGGGGGLLGGLFGGLFGGGGGGGLFGLFAQGGLVRMAGGGPAPNRDSVPALLMPGEYVLRKSAVDAIGRGELDRINRLPGVMNQSRPFMEKQEGQQGGGTVNVWVVSPDQVPPPGPKDVVAYVSDNIQRGGSLKQLIKQVSMGQAL